MDGLHHIHYRCAVPWTWRDSHWPRIRKGDAVKALQRGLVLCLALALIGAPSMSGALTPLDNFNSKPIDPDTWFGFESGGTSDTLIEELFRRIVADFITSDGGLLALTLTSYGDTSSNIGF